MAIENQLPLNINMASLPVGFNGTPQEIGDAIAERMEITTQQLFALFSVGATAPTSDLGPWAKNGNRWYYWDNETGDYIPFEITDEQRQSQTSVSEPTSDSIITWYQIDTDGHPVAIKHRVTIGGTVTWESAYYLKTEVYTQAETDLAIVNQDRYATRAKPNANQTVPIDTAYHKLLMNAEVLDPGGNYTEADSRYIAPVKGIYEATGALEFDNDGGVSGSMEIIVSVWSNGVGTGTNQGGAQTDESSPSNDRWNVPLTVMFQAEPGDQIELGMSANDGVNGADLTLIALKSYWSVKLIQTVA